MERKSLNSRIFKKTSIVVLILLTIFIGLIVISNYIYVLPIMDKNDYCIETITDKADGYTIYLYHNKNCPEHTNHWFSEKDSKYDIIIRQNASFCTICFDEDEILKLLLKEFDFKGRENNLSMKEYVLDSRKPAQFFEKTANVNTGFIMYGFLGPRACKLK